MDIPWDDWFNDVNGDIGGMQRAVATAAFSNAVAWANCKHNNRRTPIALTRLGEIISVKASDDIEVGELYFPYFCPAKCLLAFWLV